VEAELGVRDTEEAPSMRRDLGLGGGEGGLVGGCGFRPSCLRGFRQQQHQDASYLSSST